MKFFILLGLIAACNAAADLRVRFGVNPFGSFFIHIPLTVSSAVSQGWTLTTRPSNTNLPSLEMYCLSDRLLCAFYDDNSDVAGLQIGLPTDQFSGAVYDWPKLGFTAWNPPGEESRTFWTIQQYFVSEATLKLDKEVRKAARVPGRVLQDDAVWVTGFNGVLEKISTSQTDIEASIFTRQACVVLMGRHYYYNMTPDMPCTDETMFPWFSMTGSGTMHAIGFMIPGKLTINSGDQDWFEAPSASDVEMIVPDGPQCLYDLASDPGMLTMHIYYVDNPYLIHCIGN